MNQLDLVSDMAPASDYIQPAIIPSLQNTSMDVLLEIMAYLEWYELLGLRQVCITLDLSTRERVLWQGLVRSSPARFMLNRRIQMSDSNELEQTFLRYQLVQRKWAANPALKVPAAPRRYTQIVGHGCEAPFRIRNGRLLPGGRWFIRLVDYGELVYTDLDHKDVASSQLIWHRLIPPRPRSLFDRRDRRFTDDGTSWRHLQLTVDIDADAEYLTVNVLVASLVKPLPGDHSYNTMYPVPTKVEVWQLTSDFDKDGSVTGLKSSRVATLEIWDLYVTLIRYPLLCLRGNYFACCASVYGATQDTYILVFDWRVAASGGLARDAPRLCIPLRSADSLESIHIIPDHRILCKYGTGEPRWRMISWASSLSTTAGIFTNTTTGIVTDIPSSSIIKPVMHATSLAICVCPPCVDDPSVISYTTISSYLQPLYVTFKCPTPDVQPVVALRSHLGDHGPPSLSAHVRSVGVVHRYLHVDRLGGAMRVSTGAFTRDDVTGAVYLCIYRWGDIPSAVSSKDPGPYGDADWTLDDISGRCILNYDHMVEFE